MKNKVEGSYTVEAALLFPIIFFVIIWLIYLGFYLHDKNRLHVIADDSLLKARYLLENETDLTDGNINYEEYRKRGALYRYLGSLEEKNTLLQEYAKEQLMKGLLISEDIKVKTTLSHFEIKVNVTAKVNIPINQVEKLFGGKLTLTSSRSIPLMDTEEFLRIFDIFSGVAEKIPAANNGLSRLSELVN